MVLPVGVEPTSNLVLETSAYTNSATGARLHLDLDSL